MSWKYRRAGDWQIPTIKKREDGKWVDIGGGGDDNRKTDPSDIPDRFYTDGPGERDGTTVTYPKDGHSSIQAAIDSLSEGDTLYIEPGTYTEQIYFDGSQANHITIESDLRMDYDSFGEATVTQDGAYIDMPSGESTVLDCGSFWLSSTDELTDLPYEDPDELALTAATQDTIGVTDASQFSVGDDILIRESDTAPYGEPNSGGAKNSKHTGEIRTVEAVDTSNDELTLDVPLFMPYPGTGSSNVTILNPWQQEDLCIRGITFRGTGESDSANIYPVTFEGIKNGWIENVRVQEAGTNPLMRHSRCYEMRFDKLRFTDSWHYGLQNTSMSCRTLVTNASADNIRRYCVMAGAGSNMSSDVYIDGVHGHNFKTRATVDVHYGAFHIQINNVYSEGTKAMTPRSRHIHIDGWESKGGSPQSASGTDIVLRQRPYDLEIHNGTVHSRTTTAPVFDFGLRDASDSAYGNEWFDRILIENVTIKDYGVDITDIGQFVGDQECGSLTLRNIIYNGQKLTESHVQQWSGYNNVTINDLTVE